MNSYEDLIESDPIETTAGNADDDVPADDVAPGGGSEDAPASTADNPEPEEPAKRTPAKKHVAPACDAEDTNRFDDVDEESDAAEERDDAEVSDRDEEDFSEEVFDEPYQYLAVFAVESLPDVGAPDPEPEPEPVAEFAPLLGESNEEADDLAEIADPPETPIIGELWTPDSPDYSDPFVVFMAFDTEDVFTETETTDDWGWFTP